MFARFISLLVLVAPLASALTISSITGATSGGPLTINWTLDGNGNDPTTFSFELIHTTFNNAFAIANNVDPASLSLTVVLPVIPASASPNSDDYTIQAVEIGNVNNVFSTSPPFSVGATITSSVSGTTTSTTKPLTGTTTTALPTTANLPVTSVTSASVISSVGSTGASTGASTGSVSSSAESSTPSSAAVSSRFALTNACGYAALLLSAVAGAAAVAL